MATLFSPGSFSIAATGSAYDRSCGKSETMTDLMAKLEFKTQDEMLDEIIVLRNALMLIARKKKMDSVAAVSMRAIAIAAISPAVREGKND
jgi:hypothetical protein